MTTSRNTEWNVAHVTASSGADVSDLLARLDAVERELVEDSAMQHAVDRGQYLFHQGDAPDRFYVLVAGRVQVERDGHVLGELRSGQFFGESSLIMNGRRSASVVAVEPSLVWSVDHVTFDRVLCHHLLGEEERRREVLTRIEHTDPGVLRP